MSRIWLVKLLWLVLLLSGSAQAQILKTVKWSYAAKKVSATEAVVYFKAEVADGWHIYSVKQKPGGPLKTSFKFSPSVEYMPVNGITEPKPISKYEETFGIQVDYFENEVVFQQKVKILRKALDDKDANEGIMVKGKISFMTCDEKQCTPPLEVEFSVPIK